jgi:ubiquinone/menaquinone biosynthesis C-methylase UbiE
VKDKEIETQRSYYATTAAAYDDMHVSEHDEHGLALHLLAALVEFHGVRSILDIGSGTGRAMLFLKRRCPGLRVAGVEPSVALREVAYAKGVPRDDLADGDACALGFSDGAFDVVCEFGVLHHIRDDLQAVCEMARVARTGVFISDSNNFGQGSLLLRAIKQGLHRTGLWPLADYLKTRGKGYTFSEGDGLAYSYSVFESLKAIAPKFPFVTYLNTQGTGENLYRSAGHVAVYCTAGPLANYCTAGPLAQQP